MIIDASDQVLGRLASKVANEIMDGKKVDVVNTDNVIITGDPEKIVEKYVKRKKSGDPHHGPYYPTQADKIFRRTVRGMIPIKKSSGRQAYKRLKTYKRNPFDEEGKRIAKSKKDIVTNYITLKEISKKLKHIS